MPPPALVVAGLVVIPISIGISLTVYAYRRLRARRAQQRAQHPQWHRENALEIELSPLNPEADAQQAVARVSWPRSLHSGNRVRDARFTPTRTFPVPYWGPRDEWGPRDVLVSSLYACPAPGLEKSSRPQVDQMLSRRETTLDTKVKRSFPCRAEVRESTDPSREMWRRIDARQTLEDEAVSGVRLQDGVGAFDDQVRPSNTVEGFKVEKVAAEYALAARRLRSENNP
jgi:hypothetical protein